MKKYVTVLKQIVKLYMLFLIIFNVIIYIVVIISEEHSYETSLRIQMRSIKEKYTHIRFDDIG